MPTISVFPEFLVRQFASFMFVTAIWTIACDSLLAQQKSPYEDALVEFGYQPSGEGARQFLRSLLPNQESRIKAEKLLVELDATDYYLREAATKKLLAMPNLPFALLNQAAESGGIEVRWRARHVLEYSHESSSRLLLASLKIITQDPPPRATPDVLAIIPYCRASYVISTAHDALRSVVGKDDEPLLTQRLAHSNPKVRVAAIVGITQILRKNAIVHLQPLLDDVVDDVSLAASRALANAGDRRSLKCLLRLLDSADSQVRAESAIILRMLTAKNFGYVAYETTANRQAAIGLWREWMDGEGATSTLHYPLATRLSARGELNGNTLVSTGSKGKVMELDPAGKAVWTYDSAAWSAEKLLNGNVLVASYTAKKVVEVDSAGNVVWELSGPSAMTAKPLRNGNFLIADFAGRRVIEVDRKKRTVWESGTTQQCFDADRLPNGNTIYGCPNHIREITPKGDVVHEWEIPGRLNGFQALPNGNVLVANYGQNKVYELTRDGEIIWEFAEPQPCDVFRLDNGRVLVSTSKRIVEVGPEKTVVRVLTDARYGSARR
jgi:hypothetical protein